MFVKEAKEMKPFMDVAKVCVICRNPGYDWGYCGSIDVVKINCVHCREYKVTGCAISKMINRVQYPFEDASESDACEAISRKFKQNSQSGVENLIKEFSDYETLLESLSNS